MTCFVKALSEVFSWPPPAHLHMIYELSYSSRALGHLTLSYNNNNYYYNIYFIILLFCNLIAG